MMKTPTVFLLLIGLVSVFSSAPAANNLAGLTIEGEDISQFLTYSKANGIVGDLARKEPFTVFAPNNAAFDKLPTKTLRNLLKNKNKNKLVAILKYHVVTGTAVKSADLDLEVTNTFKTLAGRNIVVERKNNGVFVNTNTKVISTNNMVGNGVTHVIDKVLSPQNGETPTKPTQNINIIEFMTRSTQQLSMFVASLDKVGLTTILKDKGPYTVFAPSNKAFAKLPPGTVDSLTTEQFRHMLSSHILPHVRVLKKDVPTGGVTAKTISGVALVVQSYPNGLKLKLRNTLSKVLSADNSVNNGVVYVVDTVLV